MLAEPSFREAARKVSVRMRAHRLKPAEKAAGAAMLPQHDTHAVRKLQDLRNGSAL